MRDLEFGLAREDEAPAILGLFSSLFPAERQRWVPLGSPGALAYLCETISRQDVGGENVWVVARDGAVAGCAEIRRAPDRLFLNHVLVRADLQGQGVGRRLLGAAFGTLARPGMREVMLDVFSDNARARAWYERLGFQTLSVTRWENVPWPGAASACGQWSLTGLPQADCVHARYGFSMFDLTTSSGVYQVGRLGPELFRLSDERALKDSDAWAALRAVGPERAVLLLRRVAEGPGQPEPELMAWGMRMSMGIHEALRKFDGA